MIILTIIITQIFISNSLYLLNKRSTKPIDGNKFKDVVTISFSLLNLFIFCKIPLITIINSLKKTIILIFLQRYVCIAIGKFARVEELKNLKYSDWHGRFKFRVIIFSNFLVTFISHPWYLPVDPDPLNYIKKHILTDVNTLYVWYDEFSIIQRDSHYDVLRFKETLNSRDYVQWCLKRNNDGVISDEEKFYSNLYLMTMNSLPKNCNFFRYVRFQGYDLDYQSSGFGKIFRKRSHFKESFWLSFEEHLAGLVKLDIKFETKDRDHPKVTIYSRVYRIFLSKPDGTDLMTLGSNISGSLRDDKLDFCNYFLYLMASEVDNVIYNFSIMHCLSRKLLGFSILVACRTRFILINLILILIKVSSSGVQWFIVYDIPGLLVENPKMKVIILSHLIYDLTRKWEWDKVNMKSLLGYKEGQKPMNVLLERKNEMSYFRLGDFSKQLILDVNLMLILIMISNV